jgi:hypothetical protein
VATEETSDENRGTLTITSLLSIFLFAFHWVDEIVRGLEPGGISGIGGVVILVVWLSGPLVFSDRRSGYIIMLLGGILGAGVLVLHMMGAGLVGGRIANSGGKYFWVLTLIALGASGALSVVLSMRGLWSARAARNV